MYCEGMGKKNGEETKSARNPLIRGGLLWAARTQSCWGASESL